MVNVVRFRQNEGLNFRGEGVAFVVGSPIHLLAYALHLARLKPQSVGWELSRLQRFKYKYDDPDVERSPFQPACLLYAIIYDI
jgi:hypothetical protein